MGCEMRLTNYLRVHSGALRREMQDVIREHGVNDHERINAVLDNYLILEKRPRKNGKLGFLWRLTSLLMIPCWLLLFAVIMPLKWLFTGSYYWGFSSIVAIVARKWEERM